jgi:hypothetical protein
MNDNDKLKQILTNVIKNCNGEIFYHIVINGQTTRYYNHGILGMVIEMENTGETIEVIDITNVTFDSDTFFAEFTYNGESYGMDITRDMSPREIIDELL